MKQVLLLFLFLISTGFISAQKTVMGTVTDDKGNPLIGANIVAKEASGVGTITDVDGHFKLDVPANVNTLVFSYAGFGSKELAIGTSSTLNVSLSEGTILDELVVVGYGTKSTRFNTQSVAALGKVVLKTNRYYLHRSYCKDKQPVFKW